jgi:elongation factor P
VDSPSWGIEFSEYLGDFSGASFMIKAVELRKGKTVLYDGQIYVVHEVHHVAKGNKRSYMQGKLKNLKNGVIQEVRFNVDDRLEVPFVESKEYEYLYPEGGNYVVMDTTTYDQIPISGDLFGDAVKFLKANEKVTVTICEGEMIGVELPFIVELEVKDAPPVVKGSTATNQLKEAIMETGVVVRVPPFIVTGERVRVDTRTGEYVDRAK